MTIVQDFSSTPYSDSPPPSPSSKASTSNQHPPAITSEEQRPIQVIYCNGLTYEGLSVNGSLQGKGRIIQCGGKKVLEAVFQPQGRVVINLPNGITKRCRMIKGHLVTEKVRFPSGNIFRGRIENEDLGEELFSGKGELIDAATRRSYKGRFVSGELTNEEETISSAESLEPHPLQGKKNRFPSRDFQEIKEAISNKKKLKTILELSRQETPPPFVVTRAEVCTSSAKIKSENRKEEEFEERRRIERDKFLVAEVKKKHLQITRERSSKNLLAQDLQQSTPPPKKKRSRGDKIYSFFHRIRLCK